MGKIVSLAVGCALALCMAVTPVWAGSPFWVINDSEYEIYHVYASSDASGGNRDLLGENGVIPQWDRAQVLAPRGRACYSDVAVVAYDTYSEQKSWTWITDVDICDKRTSITVYDSDFRRWQ